MKRRRGKTLSLASALAGMVLAVLCLSLTVPTLFVSDDKKAPDSGSESFQATEGSMVQSESSQYADPPTFSIPESQKPLVFTCDETWNLLRGAGFLRGCAYENGRLLHSPGMTIAANIAVKESEVLLFYAPEAKAQVVFYDKWGRCLEEREICASAETVIRCPAESAAVSFCMADEDLQEAMLLRPSEHLLAVSQQAEAKDSGIQSSINGAVQALNEGVVLVFPGVYRENVKANGKGLTLYGVNRENCILESTQASYYAPPLEIAAGRVENLTIRAVDRDSSPSELKAYAVHVENHFLCDNTLLFRACTLYSDFNSAVGMGLRGGCEVRFEDCVLKGLENGLFCHDSAYQKYSGVQRLVLKDCTVAGMTGGNAIRLDSQGVEGARVELLFQNNEFLSGDGSTENLLYVRNNNGRGSAEDFLELKNFRLQKESRNNNIAELNFKD